VPDAVVIGAGPNGLVAANVLADRGWSVVVLEAEPEPGGAVRSAELIEPGFINDLFSAFYPLAAASPAITGLDLESHGLRWCRAPLVLAHPAKDGTCAVLSTDIDETASSLEGFSAKDGDAWRGLYERWQQVGDQILGAFFRPFPPIRSGLGLVSHLPRGQRLDFARFMVLPVRRLGEESFAGAGGQRLLAGIALHADLAPEASLSGLFGWMLACIGQQIGWPVPEGGSSSLTNALVRRLESRGGEVRCNAPVEHVIIRGKRAVAVRLQDGTEVDAGKAVIADVDAPRLYLDLIGEDHLPAKLVDELTRFQWDTATFKVDWTLDAPIPWRREEAGLAGTVHLTDSVNALSVGSTLITMGTVPEHPFLLVGQQSMTDPTRMPAGRETVWAYTHLPRKIRNDALGQVTGNWAGGDAERFADRMENEIEDNAPGFKELIRGRHIFAPPDLEARNHNLANGAINGGTAQLHQQLVFRPVPSALGRAETPIAGLFLGSSSAHPGGGVHGACGANAARAAIAAAVRRSLRHPWS
jgi:phytoene dehydrogenase-like protein